MQSPLAGDGLSRPRAQKLNRCRARLPLWRRRPPIVGSQGRRWREAGGSLSLSRRKALYWATTSSFESTASRVLSCADTSSMAAFSWAILSARFCLVTCGGRKSRRRGKSCERKNGSAQWCKAEMCAAGAQHPAQLWCAASRQRSSGGAAGASRSAPRHRRSHPSGFSGGRRLPAGPWRSAGQGQEGGKRSGQACQGEEAQIGRVWRQGCTGQRLLPAAAGLRLPPAAQRQSPAFRTPRRPPQSRTRSCRCGQPCSKQRRSRRHDGRGR